MKTIQYDKLIRDKIPEVIMEAGKHPFTEMIPEQEIGPALDKKLQEEVQEYLESKNIEEMADILEVLHGIAFHMGVSWDDIEQERIRKRNERGGFEKGIRLLRVDSQWGIYMTTVLRTATGNSGAEDRFIELFCDAFGAEKIARFFSSITITFLTDNTK